MNTAAQSSRRKTTEVLLFVLWTGCLLTTLIFVNRFGIPVPYADDWANVSRAVGKQPVTLEWLWSYHNEHRIPLTRLIYVALIRVSGNQFRAIMFFDVMVLGSLALGFLFFVRKLRGHLSWTDSFFPVCLLNIGQAENLIWAFQISFIFSAALYCLALMLIARSSSESGFPTFLMMAIFVVLLPLTGATGLLVQPPLLIWFLIWGLIQYRRNQLSKIQTLIILTVASIAIAISCLYFVNYHPPTTYRSFRPADVWRGSQEFLSTAFGPAAHPAYKTSSAVILGSIILTFGFLFRAWKTQPEQRIRISGMALFHCSWMLLMLGIAAGRSGSGFGIAGSARYAVLTFGILCGIYVITVLFGSGILQRLIPGGLLFMTLAALPANVKWGLDYARWRDQCYARFQDDVRAGIPVEALAARDLEAIFPFYGPHMFDFIHILQEYKLGPFAEATVPPVPAQPLEIQLFLRDKGPRYYFLIRPPQRILGFRFSYRMEDQPPKDHKIALTWGKAPDGSWHTLSRDVPSAQAEQTETLWIYDSVFEIGVTAPNQKFLLTKMTLLLPPEGEPGYSAPSVSSK